MDFWMEYAVGGAIVAPSLRVIAARLDRVPVRACVKGGGLGPGRVLGRAESTAEWF